MARTKKKRSQFDKLLPWAISMATLYFILDEYYNSIIYFGYAEYFIYLPILLLGIFVLKKIDSPKDFWIINWFARIVFSVMLYYIPFLTLFTGCNYLYVKDKRQQSVSVSLIDVVNARRGRNTKIIVELKKEKHFVYGFSPIIKDIVKKDKKRYYVKINFKEGLLGTYIIKDYNIYKI